MNDTAKTCVICSSTTSPEFSVSHREQSVIYYECSFCQHLTASDFDADSLYVEDEYFEGVDSEWKTRNRRILRYLRFLNILPGVSIHQNSTTLDFGCGVGQLVSDLEEEGFEAWGYEPFPNRPPKSSRVFSEWSKIQSRVDSIELATAIEVLEHLRKPGRELRSLVSIMRSQGYLLVSTEIYDPKKHTEKWYYLNPAAGHVSIFTEQSLRLLMEQLGLHPVLRVTDDVWLFKKVEKASLADSLYFSVSQLRLRLGLRRSSFTPREDYLQVQ